MWRLEFTGQAAKDAKKLKAAGLDKKAKSLINVGSILLPSLPRMSHLSVTFQVFIPWG